MMERHVSALNELEKELLAVIREYRRVGNMTVRTTNEVDRLHKNADRLLKLEPDLDDERQRWNAHHRVEHRAFVDRLFDR